LTADRVMFTFLIHRIYQNRIWVFHLLSKSRPDVPSSVADSSRPINIVFDINKKRNYA